MQRAGDALGHIPARLRSLLTFGLADFFAAQNERMAAIERGVQGSLAETAAMRAGIEERLSRIELKLQDVGNGPQSDKLDSLLSEVAEIKRLGARISPEIDAVRSLVASEAERAQRKLRAGLSSAVKLLAILRHVELEGGVSHFS